MYIDIQCLKTDKKSWLTFVFFSAISMNIYGHMSLNDGISWGLAAPRPPHGFPRVLGHGVELKNNF